MADDQQNPYTMMGMAQMMMPNPFIDAQFSGKPLKMPGFRGPATDAKGNVIDSYAQGQAAHDAWNKANPAAPQGTTLTSLPDPTLEAKGSQARAMQDAGYGNWALLDPTMASSHIPGQTGGSQSVGATTGWNPANPASATGGGQTGGGGMTQDQMMASFTPQQQQWWAGAPASEKQQALSAYGVGRGAAPAAQTNPFDMNQIYKDALANPGKVTTPGAHAPMAKPLGQPSVMDAFLNNNKGTGNKSFFDTLNKLRGSA